MPSPLNTNALPGRIAFMAGREYLYCSGTGYLGIHADADFQALVAEGLAYYGGHYGGSRLSQVLASVFEAAEARLTAWTGAGAALVLSSGTLAGQLVVRYLLHSHTCYFAPGVHPALWGSDSVGEGNVETWTEKVLESARRSPGPIAVFANAIDPLYARRFDFEWIRQLPAGLPVCLVLDDSHGIGVTGQNGGGIYTEATYPPNVTLVVTSSLGKAPGVPAGVVLGPKDTVEAIRQSPLCGGASPPTPAFLHALVHGEAIYRRNLDRLVARSRQFAAGLYPVTDFRYLPDYPVFYTPHHRLAVFLEERGILISSFPYPSPSDIPVTRLVLHALLTEEDVGRLLEACTAWTVIERAADR